MPNTIHNLARAVIIHQNHLLVCKAHNVTSDYYFLPGGHIEHGESATKTVIRELLEESSHAIAVDKFLGCLESSFNPSTTTKKCHTHEYNIIFEAHFLNIANPFDIVSQENHIKFCWIALSEISKKNLLPTLLKKFIPEWLIDSNTNPFISDIR